MPFSHPGSTQTSPMPPHTSMHSAPKALAPVTSPGCPHRVGILLGTGRNGHLPARADFPWWCACSVFAPWWKCFAQGCPRMWGLKHGLLQPQVRPRAQSDKMAAMVFAGSSSASTVSAPAAAQAISIESWSHGVFCVGRDLGAPPVSAPCPRREAGTG